MTFPTIAELGELALIEEIKKLYSCKSPDVLVGIGDDAAVLRVGGKYLLVTSDMMVEGVHFDLRFVTAYQVGFKLISVNVSDIYAMGGTPRYALLSMALRGRTPGAFVRMLLDGVRDALAFYRALLVGGDLSSAKDGMSLSATLIGSTAKYCLRAGARVGDRIYVTGNLGDASCGLCILEKVKKTVPLTLKKADARIHSLWKKVQGMRPGSDRAGLPWKAVEPLLRRHLLPRARNPRAVALRASSMIDLSDGLLIDLTRLCDESGVGARIYEDNIPLSKEMRRVAEYFGIDPLKLAMTGGEDYELLFTAPKKKRVKAAYIGDITDSERVVVNSSGQERPFSAQGYRHFG